MSRNYKFHNHDGVYFVSFAVIEWLNVFTDYAGEKGILDDVIVVK